MPLRGTIRQALAVSAVLLLLSGCIYVAVPRPTYIRPGIDAEAGAGVAVLRSKWHGPTPVGQGSARLGLNPSNWLGFDLSIYGCWGGGPFDVPPFGASLAARVRPIAKVNTMLFGEASLGCLHAGIAQGMPVTGREVVTLALTAGKWPSANRLQTLDPSIPRSLDPYPPSIADWRLTDR